jgi:hypothetical protein
LAHDQGDIDHGTALVEEALALARQLADRIATAYMLNSVGVIAYHHGDFERCHAYLRHPLLSDPLALRQAALRYT